MPVGMLQTLQGVTKEQYDQVRTEVGWLEKAPTGGLSHIAWWEGEDNHNLDAWESEAAFGTFAETRLGPAMQKAGVDRQPEVTFHPAHEVFLPKARTDFRLPPDRYSITANGTPSCSPTSKMRTTCGCDRLTSERTSCTKRRSAWLSPNCENLGTLTTTSMPRFLSLAR